MSHLKAKFINAGGMSGEFDVSDFVVFANCGELAHVSKFWDAVVSQSLILDRAHASSLESWTAAAEDWTDPEFGFEASWRKEILTLSDQYLVKANIYILLLSFFEFSMLEVFKLKFGVPLRKSDRC